jgi:hypothetical protein
LEDNEIIRCRRRGSRGKEEGKAEGDHELDMNYEPRWLTGCGLMILMYIYISNKIFLNNYYKRVNIEKDNFL